MNHVIALGSACVVTLWGARRTVWVLRGARVTLLPWGGPRSGRWLDAGLCLVIVGGLTALAAGGGPRWWWVPWCAFLVAGGVLGTYRSPSRPVSTDAQE
ncbi:hypothetical protein ET495_13215 [Xylanimonas allomyrinae]|uniref:Uncharacterized protein n=1 Tax=Xylanimonas allomyrinae TaxID=2509459 RepID=A0A4P6EQB1_9MICO|nr:hypothetical protein [Xylanimonas allomyrinae]QAY64023.1 hypothetical protein ET495_13215 [Xylanimonas allomyrinae]